MEVDSSLEESSVSKAEDGQKSQSTETKPLEYSVAVSSVHLSAGNPSSSVASSVTPDTDNKSLQNVLPERQDMHVEKLCKVKENFKDAPACLQNESDGEHVGLNQAAIITTESHLSTKEECANQIDSKAEYNAGHEAPKANCNDGVRHGSKSVQQAIISEECPGKEDNSVQHQSEVKTNVPGNSLQSSLTSQTCSMTEPKRTVEDIQNVSASVVTATVLKTAEDQNSYGGQDSESSCAEINGVTSGESSDEEEFLGLKRKVRGICLRPVDLESATSNKLSSNEKHESIGQIQGTNNDTEEEQPEIEKYNGHLKDSTNTTDMCKPVILEDRAGVDVKQKTELAKKYKHESENYQSNSLPIVDAHNQQEECVLSGSFGPNMDDGLKEHGNKPKDPSLKCQDIHPASSVSTPTLSRLDKSVSLPLTDVASQNALISTQSPESIGQVLTEMGPPLPPVVLPLTATPPKFRKDLTPNRPTIQLSTWSSTEGPFSLKHQSKDPSPGPGLQDEVKTSLSLTTPSPSHGVPSSPLQFGSATPKHALPVPGRLPPSVLNSSSPSASQENSMQMLDTMYPELSAQARTLNILRGNVNIGSIANENGASSPTVNPISGNKTINSSSTAFTKTDRISANVLLPKSAKRLRLDTCSPDPSSLTPAVQQDGDNKPSNGVASSSNPMARKEGKTVGNANDPQSLIYRALEKLQNSCFDVLPVIRSHMFLGRISEVPVLRDEEKCVISDFCLNQVKYYCLIVLFNLHVIQI